MFPDFIQSKMDQWRHDTSLDSMSPEQRDPHKKNSQRHHRQHQYNHDSRSHSNNYPHHMNDKMRMTFHADGNDEPCNDERLTFAQRTGLFLPVSQEIFPTPMQHRQSQYQSQSFHSSPPNHQNGNDKSFHDDQNLRNQYFEHDRQHQQQNHQFDHNTNPHYNNNNTTSDFGHFLINNSMTAGRSMSMEDLSGVKILPQMLGISQSGELVLLPLATNSTNFGNLSFNSQHQSPVVDSKEQNHSSSNDLKQNEQALNRIQVSDKSSHKNKEHPQNQSTEGGVTSLTQQILTAKQHSKSPPQINIVSSPTEIENDQFHRLDLMERLKQQENQQKQQQQQQQQQQRQQQQLLEKARKLADQEKDQKQQQLDQENKRRNSDQSHDRGGLLRLKDSFSSKKSPSASSSPSLKKQKSPMFSKLKSLAKFSPSTKHSKHNNYNQQDVVIVDSPMSEIAPSSFAIEEEEIVEESKIAVVEQENLSTSPASSYNSNKNDNNNKNAANNTSPGQHDTILSEGDLEDEEDLRLHTKSMSRAISDIEELSENSSRVTPKRRKSPGTSQPHTDDDDGDDDNESLKENTRDKSRTENSSRQNDSSKKQSMKEDSPDKFSSPTQNSSMNRNNKNNNSNNSSGNNKDSSMFSDFSDHSEFELPSAASNASKSTLQNKKAVAQSPPAPVQNTSGGKISPPVPALQKHRTYSQDSHVDGSLDDLPPLLLIMKCLTEKVKDEESEEVLVLNIDVNTNQANTIIGYVLF